MGIESNHIMTTTISQNEPIYQTYRICSMLLWVRYKYVDYSTQEASYNVSWPVTPCDDTIQCPWRELQAVPAYAGSHAVMVQMAIIMIPALINFYSFLIIYLFITGQCCSFLRLLVQVWSGNLETGRKESSRHQSLLPEVEPCNENQR